MADFKEIFSSKFFIIFLFLVIVGLGFSLFKINYKKYQIKKEISFLEEESHNLKYENDNFANLIEYFGSSDSIEKEARTKLNLKRPGENVVVVLPKEDDNSVEGVKSVGNVKEEQKQTINWERWRAYFFK